MSATPLANSPTAPASATPTSVAPAIEATRFKLILPRQAILLGVTALLQALATVWVLQPLKLLPYSGMLHSLLLPQMLCGLSLGLGVVFAPFYVERALPVTQSILRALYIAVWTGVILLFGLLVASRLAPLDIIVIIGAAALLAGFNFIFQLLALVLPRAYSGVVLLWVVVLPCAAYFIAEIYLMQVGRQVWTDLTTPASEAVRSLVHYLLNLSPGTLLMSLTGAGLADGRDVQWLPPLALMGIVTTGCILALASLKGDRVKEP